MEKIKVQIIDRKETKKSAKILKEYLKVQNGKLIDAWQDEEDMKVEVEIDKANEYYFFHNLPKEFMDDRF